MQQESFEAAGRHAVHTDNQAEARGGQDTRHGGNHHQQSAAPLQAARTRKSADEGNAARRFRELKLFCKIIIILLVLSTLSKA